MVQIVSLRARRSSCGTRRASIHWSRTSRCLLIPRSPSMDNACSSRANASRKTHGRSGRWLWQAASLAASPPAMKTVFGLFTFRKIASSTRERPQADSSSRLWAWLAESLQRSPTGRRTFCPRMFSAMAESCSKPRIRSALTPFRKSTPSIPTAVESSRIAAITAQRVTPAGKSVREISSSPRRTAWQGSPRRRRRQSSISVPAGEYAGEVVETAAGDWLMPWRPDAKAPLSTDVLDSGFIRVAPRSGRTGL